MATHVPIKNGVHSTRNAVAFEPSAHLHSRHPETSRDIADYTPTQDDINEEVEFVQSLKLSADLRGWVDRYGEVGMRGGPYLWNWCRRGVEVIGLPSVPHENRKEQSDLKFLGAMLDVLLDDVADKGGNPVFLDHLIELYDGRGDRRRRRFSVSQQKYSRFTEDLCREIHSRVRRLPRFEEFQSILEFDVSQMFNAMRYSLLLNANPAMLNLSEHDLYLPHNMYMMIFSTLDLMNSPGFDLSELGLLREAVLKGQYMGRIGNLVTTWQREIGENDFSSGVFARAVSTGDLDYAELNSESADRLTHVIQQGAHENYFLGRWQQCRRELLEMSSRFHTVDLEAVVRGLQRLLCLHLGSRGSK